MNFDEVISEYLSSVRHRSIERDEFSLQRLRPHFSGRDVRTIRRLDVRRYIDERLSAGVKPSTVNRELDLFSAAVNYVRFIHELDLPNPVHRMSLREPEGRVRWLTRDEAERLISAAASHPRLPQLQHFIRLALHTGCRRNELLALEWYRVDFERRFLRLEPKDTKNGRRRVVPLNDHAQRALRDLRAIVDETCPGSKWVFVHPSGQRVHSIQRGFRAACERAGIEDFRIHDLRHTFASWLVMQGVSLLVVRDLLGHSSVEMTERYAHLAPNQMPGAVQLLLQV